MRNPKKWIEQEIERLDPEKDYVKIWRLSSSYGHDEFMNNLAYALTFQNFIVTEWGSKAVWREDGGKVLERAFSRVDQTTSANYIWWFYGPHDERTKKSVDAINNLHAYWAKKMPGVFSYNDDYIYVCAYTAVSVERFRLLLGLPGISKKEKIAAHKFWGEMSKLFYAENNTPLHGYPEDFDGLLAYCEEYEHRSRPKAERVNLIVTSFHEQFVFRFFPENLHWLGHQIMRSLSLPTTLATAQIDPPVPGAKEAITNMLGFMLSYKAQYMDDPEVSFLEELQNFSPEEKKQRHSKMRSLDKEFIPHYKETYKDDPKFKGCPFHEALNMLSEKSNKAVSPEMTKIEETSAPHLVMDSMK